MPLREPQTWQFLRGDLEPRRVEWTDLRNDYGGDQMKQAQNIVLRYLQSLPAQGTVNLETMTEDITRHYPFHGEKPEFFRQAVDALKEQGWVKETGDEIELDKVERVATRYLRACLQKTR